MKSLQTLLSPGRPLLGTFSALGSVEAVELACHAGFDFVILDGQHGSFTLPALREAIRAVDAAGSFPIVRLPAHGLSCIEALLDAGCPALLAPMVNTPEQAAELAAACYYPPRGRRSQSACRASLRDPTYRKNFNAAFSLVVMIEHLEAVRQINAIASTPGVSACFVGPTDLASSLESAPSGAPSLPEAVETVRLACATAGLPAGIACKSTEEARNLAQRGFAFIAAGTDRRLLAAGFEAAVSGWRGEGRP